MRQLGVLAGILCFCAGCASDADKAQWNEVWKDLRGDNMRMRSDFSGSTPVPEPSTQLKPREIAADGQSR
jgi:hypothetical protein